ncbi:MAG: efflux RND transporter permease subunit, partial [Bdellovibrionales bacterium]|nr:efflux RND transporter permease subunit [Bdellovibrionales bacterium]
TIVSELDSVSSLEQVIISSGFEGQKIRLSQMASVEQSFEKSTTVRKINGHEGIILNIQKSSNTDILTAQKAVIGFVDRFSKQNGQARMKVVLMDDESFDVRNRLSIIGTNGAIGFILIVFILFFFLDFRSGVWVAMGIPFSLAFTLMFAFVIGYTINNMTLAAIIVVLGIVVDDAIIVAENIIRNLKGNSKESAVASTARVFSPIVASILTTCAAFIPLYFFSGRFGLFVKYLPAIIFCMLAASLIESIFILPSHMAHKMKIEIWLEQFEFPKKFGKFRENFIHVIENIYIQTVVRILNFRTLVISCFLILILASAYIFSTKLKYVMFPREESKDFRVKVVVPEGSTRLETAKSVRKIEDIFNSNKYVVGTITTIGQSRRGGEVRENEASLRVEVVPPDERDLTLNAMFSEWEKTFETFKEYKQIKLYKSRWGSDSGSAIAIEIQESDDQHRNLIAERLKTQLDKLPYLSEVEIERPISKNEYRLEIKTNDASQVGVNFNQLSSVLRAYVEGDILYTLNSGVEEVDVRLTSLNAAKESIDELTNLTVANNSNYLVPIKNIVQVVKGKKPSNIQRVNFKRTTMVYADLKSEAKITPLEIADYLENKIFHQVTEGIPSANIVFRGEIEDSRESQSEFTLSIILVISLIFVLLVFLYDSVWSPLLIAAIIPFGLIGSIFAFWLQGMNQYGFFAVVGALGMIGVVVNDSIVLVDILNEAFKDKVNNFNQLIVRIAEVTSTRLRAVVVTTLTTVAGIIPTAYGFGGYDSMLSEMMLAMGWGLLFGMFVTLLLVPCLYSFYAQLRALKSGDSQ